MFKRTKTRRGPKLATISRRSFVRGLPLGLAAAAAASPLLGRIIARAAEPPQDVGQCFIMLYTADGVIPDWWWPAAPGPLSIPDDRLEDLSGTSFNTQIPAQDQPTFLLQPIAPYAGNTLMVMGLQGGPNDHGPAAMTLLTGGEDVGDSVDTYISHAIERPENFARVLRMGVYGNQVSYNTAWSVMKDNGNWITPSWQPVADAQQVLNAIGSQLPLSGGDGSVDPPPPPPPPMPTAEGWRMSRMSALGAVRQHMQQFACVAGTAAADRAEAYLEEVANLEAIEQQIIEDQLNQPPPDPDPDPNPNPGGLGDPFTIDIDTSDPTLIAAQTELSALPTMLPFMRDLSIASLATGYTQTIGQLWGASGANKIDNGQLTDYRYENLPHLEYSGAGDHGLAHPGDGAFMDAGHTISAEVSTRDRTRIQRFFYQQVRSLLDRLSGIPYGGGTLFDYTTVMVCSEFQGCPSNSYAGQHDTSQVPMMLIAGSQTPFQTGQCVGPGGGGLHDFLSTVAQGYGASMGGGFVPGILV